MHLVSRPLTLTEQVIQDLRSKIERGAYALGDRLPTGKQLAAEYGVSTMVIREVTEHLRTQGYIETRQGVGSTVRARTSQAGFQLPPRQTLDAAELAEVYELRLDLESAVAGLAAQRRDARDIAELGAILLRLERNLRDARSTETDAEFHLRIAAATRNKYHQQLLHYLNAQLLETVRIARTNTMRQADLPEQVHQEHVILYDAIKAGDPVLARAAATSHLLRAMARLGLRRPS